MILLPNKKPVTQISLYFLSHFQQSVDPSTKKYVEPEKLRSKQRFYWTIRHNDFGGASCFFSHIMFLFTVSVAPSHIQIKMASYLRGPSTRRSWLPWGVRDQIMQSNQKGKHMESTESRLDTKFHDLFPSIYNIYLPHKTLRLQ